MFKAIKGNVYFLILGRKSAEQFSAGEIQGVWLSHIFALFFAGLLIDLYIPNVLAGGTSGRGIGNDLVSLAGTIVAFFWFIVVTYGAGKDRGSRVSVSNTVKKSFIRSY